jgi:23S rRNA (uracil1939-C5)-methyltransferase
MSAETVDISELGAQGDGVAHTETGPVFVPFTLPGETVSIAREKAKATLMAVKSASPLRVEPPCPHFGPDGEGGACGGCSLQHYDMAAYRDWKTDLVRQALAEQKIDIPLEPLIAAQPGERRRLVLTGVRTDRSVILGFAAARSHQIVPIRVCPIAVPAISQRLDTIRRVATAVATGTSPFRVSVLATVSGLDIAIAGPMKLQDRRRLLAIETILGLSEVSRVTVDGEVLVEPRRPIIQFGKASVTPVPGGFVQASASAEDHMAAIVSAHLKPSKRIADLFAGSGTFALRLAEFAPVHAVENDRLALTALDAAARATQGLRPITHQKQDLFRSPLMGSDLKPFDGLVFDPPRAGAEAQSRELARSSIKRIAAVSCNPTTLARDLRFLIDGGYTLRSVQPIDQFLWSPHVEAVALLERKG